MTRLKLTEITTENITRVLKILKDSKAVIFDVDGILINSERHHCEAHIKALSEYGVELAKADYIAHGVSSEPRIFYGWAFEKYDQKLTKKVFQNLNARKLAIYQELQSKEGIQPISSTIQLVKRLHFAGKPLAVAYQVPN